MGLNLFGGSGMVSTLDPNQRLSYNSLMSSYQRQLAQGYGPDTEAVDKYLSGTINPKIQREYQDSVNEAKANMGTGFWGSEKLSALARLQRQKNESLDNARATAMENERQSAFNRYETARQGLAGLTNMQTQAQQYKPGLLDYGNQLMGTGANAAAMYYGLKK